MFWVYRYYGFRVYGFGFYVLGFKGYLSNNLNSIKALDRGLCTLRGYSRRY